VAEARLSSASPLQNSPLTPPATEAKAKPPAKMLEDGMQKDAAAGKEP
jgi:hypothetical protein